MWWEPVFWILLIPLIVVEIIIFVKTKRIYWLIYALAIFTYVVTVSYTLDVFDANRNAIILTLIASAILMALIGRHLGKTHKKQKEVSRAALTMASILAIFMILLFAISAIFGQAEETVQPVDSLTTQEITFTVSRDEPRPFEQVDGPIILVRSITNPFVLPIPIEQKEYRACLVTSSGLQEVFVQQSYERYPEVAPGDTEEFNVRVNPTGLQEETNVTELRVYESEEYVPCSDRGAPDYLIPIE